ncbi:MAG: dinuclear metal center YbgI/SA1388 family protein [Bradymonadia bacterium]|jgi:dinuclear metal center YbgI/SA1388 family protein
MPSRAEIINLLKDVAPLALAEEWDNVGLLVDGAGPDSNGLEPHGTDSHGLDPRGAARVDTVFLTIDLTEEVLEEAISAGAQLIVAYHPPIFSGLKRLTMGDDKQRIVLRALAARVSIYSPHTALDAAPGGLCDWLLEAFGAVTDVRPITAHRAHPHGRSHGLHVADAAAKNPAVADLLSDLTAVGRLWAGDQRAVERVAGALAAAGIPAAIQAFADVGSADTGAGRRATLVTPQPLEDVVHALKKHLGLSYLRVSAAAAQMDGEPVRSVAVCPGAGGSLFEGVRGVDLLVTGEMRHHDILAHRARGASVILSDHTNTERGYLPRLAARLRAAADIEVVCSALDADPLIVA